MDIAAILSKLPSAERAKIRAALDAADQHQKPKMLTPQELKDAATDQRIIKTLKLYKP